MMYCHGCETKDMKLAATEKLLRIALTALRKIDDPQRYHHWEQDPYTRAACFQFVAHEARKLIGEFPEYEPEGHVRSE